jgi:carbon-monoxide dehydrogenase medium subunit
VLRNTAKAYSLGTSAAGQFSKGSSPMKYFDNYHLPTTVGEALDWLNHYEGRARVIAGGTDLLVDMQGEFYEGARPHYDALVDVTKIAGANEIRVDGEWIFIGCGVTHTQIEQSPLIRERGTALAEASFVVGGPQVRNVATLIGNVAHALPAADDTVALMALDAEAQVASRLGANPGDPARPQDGHSPRYPWRPLASLFRGPGESAVDAARELITAVRFHATVEHEASAFTRVMRPQGVALPILGMAAKVKCGIEKAECRMHEVAISAGPVAPTPFRATRTEEFLRGKGLTDEVLRNAAQILLDEARPRTSPHRASKEYRYELLPTLLEQTLRQAVERAK